MLADWSVQWIPAFWTIWLNIFLCFRIRFDKIDSYIGPVCVLGLFVLTDWMITFHRRSRGNVASNHIVWIRLAGWWLIIPFVHVVMKRCHGIQIKGNIRLHTFRYAFTQIYLDFFFCQVVTPPGDWSVANMVRERHYFWCYGHNPNAAITDLAHSITQDTC